MKELIAEMLKVIDVSQIKINKKTITYQGISAPHSDFIKDMSEELPDEFALTLFKANEADLMSELRKAVSKNLFKDVSSGMSIESQHYPPMTPIRDCKTGIKRLMNEGGKLSDLDYTCWFELLDSETKKIVNSAMVLTVNDYHPHKESIEDAQVDGLAVKRVNLYQKPVWRGSLPWSSPEEEVVKELPEEIQVFFDHLFLNKTDLDYVLDWVYHMMTDRMQVALVLNGAKGVGKGVFGTILQQLVGVNNHRKARVNILDTNFNSDFQYNQLMEFDELKITKQRVNHLKLYFNETLSIEVKKVDGAIRMENHNSFYISANGAGDLYLESDDRRFSVVKVTDEPLLDIWEDGEINALIDRICTEDGEMIAQIGRYILSRGSKLNYGTVKPYKTERFYELVENSLSGWQKYLFKEITEKKIDMKLNRVRSKYNQNHSKYPMPEANTPILDFLRNYRDVSGKRIADLVDGIIKVGDSPDEEDLL